LQLKWFGCALARYRRVNSHVGLQNSIEAGAEAPTQF